MATPTSAPLDGIRVLDFGRYVAGPYCAALLGDLGAEVIRVEHTEGSEDRYLAQVAGDGAGAFFLQCNRGKLGFTLDSRAERGREITRRLVRTADVVVANLPPDTLRVMGIDYPSLVVDRPDIILTMLTAFGSEGPYSRRVGFDGVGQAMSGAMYLSGTPGAPAKSAANPVDFTTALACALGTVAALLERRTTGKGQVVEGSLLGSALTLMNSTLIEQAELELDRVGTGNRSQLSGPSDTFPTKDGFVLVQTIGQPLFERWCALIGEPGWLDDPRFRDDRARGNNGLALSDRMQAWCAERTTEEALRALEGAKIPAGPVLSPREVLLHEQVLAGGFLVPVDYPGLPRPAPVARAPLTLSGGGARVRGRAPLLGEHTDVLLAELGYSEAEIADLRSRRVV